MWIKVFTVFLIGSCVIYADWNRDFDKGSDLLMKDVPAFQTEEYYQEQKKFRFIRKALLQDRMFKKKMEMSSFLDKFMILRPRDQLVIKKRVRCCYLESMAWELSLLVDPDTCFVPSFPINVDGKTVIIQQMEPFIFGHGYKELPPASVIKKVSLKEYWKAHLEAYLLGLEDLLGRNIGITPFGTIRFFDTEATFRYRKQPSRGVGVHNISVGFMSESFDWPQYRMGLDVQSAEWIQKFIEGLSSLEERIAEYERCRGVVIEEGFFERLAHIRSFPFSEGTCFRDFLGYLYPKLSLGLDELSEMISRVYGRKVDHGASLLFMYRHMPSYSLTADQTKEIDDWIDLYVD